MAVPLPLRNLPQLLVTLNVTGVGLTPLANQYDVPRLRRPASVANPVEVLSHCRLVHHLLGLHIMSYPVTAELVSLVATVRAFR